VYNFFSNSLPSTLFFVLYFKTSENVIKEVNDFTSEAIIHKAVKDMPWREFQRTEADVFHLKLMFWSVGTELCGSGRSGNKSLWPNGYSICLRTGIQYPVWAKSLTSGFALINVDGPNFTKIEQQLNISSFQRLTIFLHFFLFKISWPTPL